MNLFRLLQSCWCGTISTPVPPLRDPNHHCLHIWSISSFKFPYRLHQSFLSEKKKKKRERMKRKISQLCHQCSSPAGQDVTSACCGLSERFRRQTIITLGGRCWRPLFLRTHAASESEGESKKMTTAKTQPEVTGRSVDLTCKTTCQFQLMNSWIKGSIINRVIWLMWEGGACCWPLA